MPRGAAAASLRTLRRTVEDAEVAGRAPAMAVRQAVIAPCTRGRNLDAHRRGRRHRPMPCVPHRPLAKEAIMAVKPIPEGYRSVTPYLVVQGTATLIDFLKQAFDAQELMRMPAPDGSIMHAEVRIGDSTLMMGDARGQMKPMPSTLYLYVHDADATYKRALQAGATSTMEPADQFYGDRSAGVVDPVGNHWWIATHIEDVPPDELAERAAAHMKQHHSG
jgi:PhnB protein